MDEIGFDLRKNYTKLLNSEMVKNADRIIVMEKEETWPQYLKRSDKVTYWEIDDICGLSLEEYRNAIKKIKKLIDKLVDILNKT
jgi:protein-tyrosine-phosphatase